MCFLRFAGVLNGFDDTISETFCTTGLGVPDLPSTKQFCLMYKDDGKIDIDDAIEDIGDFQEDCLGTNVIVNEVVNTDIEIECDDSDDDDDDDSDHDDSDHDDSDHDDSDHDDSDSDDSDDDDSDDDSDDE